MRDNNIRAGLVCTLRGDRVVITREGYPAPGKSRRRWYVRPVDGVEMREPVTSSALVEVHPQPAASP